MGKAKTTSYCMGYAGLQGRREINESVGRDWGDPRRTCEICRTKPTSNCMGCAGLSARREINESGGRGRGRATRSDMRNLPNEANATLCGLCGLVREMRNQRVRTLSARSLSGSGSPRRTCEICRTKPLLICTGYACLLERREISETSGHRRGREARAKCAKSAKPGPASPASEPPSARGSDGPSPSSGSAQHRSIHAAVIR
jgi:hypothetical protein